MKVDSERPLWEPDRARVAGTRLTAFIRRVEQATGRRFPAYADLHRWSIENLDGFWGHVWGFCGVPGERGARVAVDLDRMPGARFFPDARLNFAEALLGGKDDALALISVTESGRERTLSVGELRRTAAQVAAALREDGIRPGDRVAGMMPNIAEAVIAALGAAAIGAVWSSCSPDFGVEGMLDRFGQIEPRVLVAVDAYSWGGRRFGCVEKVAALGKRLPGLERTVVVHLDGDGTLPDAPGAIAWDRWTDRRPAGSPFEPLPFDHPLYILYSSGTTGVPKCIVHGAGGTLLEHLKEHQLQSDIRAGDRVFYFTTCGWMMWNWLVSALASGASPVLYDGSPFHPDGNRLFDLADRTGVTFFGVSPKFLDTLRTSGLTPATSHRLDTIRSLASTGAPLSPEAFDFVSRSIKPDVHLMSISGGTDIVGCFVGGNPNGPVWRGEIQAPGLGMDVRALDEDGRPIDGRPGELVCRTPWPSMPIGFWRDPDGRRLREAYFSRWPNVWAHGDWIETTTHGGFVIHGRSDATLNPQGVRIGTAEIYRQVEQCPEVLESLAVGQRWDGDERIVLFVRLREGVELDTGLRRRIVERLRTQASPRHVPARIVAVTDLPRTRSGKLAELAVRKIIHGEPVPNREALANPESLELFRDVPELQEP